VVLTSFPFCFTVLFIDRHGLVLLLFYTTVYVCFLRDICSKTLHVEDLDRVENQIPYILCDLEEIFPPGFFIVMVYLVVHLVRECKLGGPVHYWWMYPIERYDIYHSVIKFYVVCLTRTLLILLFVIYIRSYTDIIKMFPTKLHQKSLLRKGT